MKYIIMAGGTYPHFKTPKQLMEINGEKVIERTIRLLKENGVEDIAISTTSDLFNDFGVPILRHDNDYVYGNMGWRKAFYPMDEPVCYLWGDVVFSKEAIKTIVNTDTDDIQFFASAPPFTKDYIKPWAEPFALKVQNIDHFKSAFNKWAEYEDNNAFLRQPSIIWEFWQVIKNTPLNKIDYTNYCVINDYTCDIDEHEDIKKLERLVQKYD